MALLSLLFGSPKKAKIGVGSDADLVPIDASINESHERSAQLTQSEIEDGSKITDHVTLDAIKFTMEGCMSDKPIGGAQASAVAAASAASFVTARIGGEVLGAAAAAGAGLVGGGITKLLLGDQKSADKCFKFFEDLWKNRELITIVTAMCRYEDMIVTNLTMPRSTEVGRSFRFTVTVQQIKVVQSQTTSIAIFKKVAPSVAHSAGKSANLGKQAAKTPEESSGSNASLLLKGLRSAGVGI